MEEQIYEYLMTNCYGYDNRKKAKTIMKKFGIKDHKTFRYHIQSIRQNYEYDRLIGSEAGYGGGYWIIKDKKEFEDTVHHLYARASEMKKNCKIMVKKWKRGNKDGRKNNV